MKKSRTGKTPCENGPRTVNIITAVLNEMKKYNFQNGRQGGNMDLGLNCRPLLMDTEEIVRPEIQVSAFKN